jgi:hypothetical protein
LSLHLFDLTWPCSIGELSYETRGGARNLSLGGPNAKNNIIKEKLIFKCIIGKSNIKNKEAKNK